MTKRLSIRAAIHFVICDATHAIHNAIHDDDVRFVFHLDERRLGNIAVNTEIDREIHRILVGWADR